MATEKRLIYMDDTMDRLRAYADRKHQAGHTELANGILKAVNYIHNEIRRVDAVEVVHGRWIKRTEVFGEIYCSECKTIEKTTDSNFKTPFCPWCGTKMDMEVDV